MCVHVLGKIYIKYRISQIRLFFSPRTTNIKSSSWLFAEISVEITSAMADQGEEEKIHIGQHVMKQIMVSRFIDNGFRMNQQ